MFNFLDLKVISDNLSYYLNNEARNIDKCVSTFLGCNWPEILLKVSEYSDIVFVR